MKGDSLRPARFRALPHENTLSPRKVFFATYTPPRKMDGTGFAACGPRTLRGCWWCGVQGGQLNTTRVGGPVIAQKGNALLGETGVGFPPFCPCLKKTPPIRVVFWQTFARQCRRVGSPLTDAACHRHAAPRLEAPPGPARRALVSRLSAPA